jgi:molybdenum cofactor biosynthesis enzyme MoaA
VQGCEGEPLLEDRLLQGAIASLREKTSKGTIHVNTNGSLPRVVERLALVGLDSIRVTLASATPRYYAHYHQPRGYGFEDVVDSIQKGKAAGLHIALNLLVFPGFTDREDEIEALIDLVQKTRIDMIQMRNLNIDPDWYLKGLGNREPQRLGISKMVGLLKETFPCLAIGYFNRTKETFPT